MLATAFVLALVLSGPKQTSAPRFTAVVQVYRSGVSVVDGSGFSSEGPFKDFGDEAELTPGPAAWFVVSNHHRVATFEGLRQRSSVWFQDQPFVIGWGGSSPIVRSGARTFLVSGGAKTPLSSARGGYEEVAGEDMSTLVCAMTDIKDGSGGIRNPHYEILSNSKIRELKGIGFGAGSLVASSQGVFIAANEDRFDGPDNTWSGYKGNLWLVDPKSGAARSLAHSGDSLWSVTWPDKANRLWITESGFFGRAKKYFQRETIYKFTANHGLERVSQAHGEFEAYALDLTGRWLLGHRVYGYEMGAYDLVARDLHSSREIAILHGVEEFKQLQ